MKLKMIAAAFAVAALCCMPALSGCSRETYVEYTLCSSEGHVVRTDNLSQNPHAVVEGQPSADSLESAPEGSYYMVTGYSGDPTDLVIPAEVNGVPVRGIGEQAFIQCRSLRSVTIEEGVEAIGGAAFAFCVNIEEASLPSTAETSYSTFASCTSLAAVTLAEGISCIGDRDFYGCISLAGINVTESSYVNLPSTLTDIEPYAFYDCSSLEGEVVIPAGVTRISGISFASCDKITGFVFLGEISVIDYAAFSGCAALKKLVLPSTVTYIGEGAFSYCASLESLALPDAIEFIGANAFEGAGVQSVVMPQGKGVWLYTEALAEDDPATEKDESVTPGSDEAQDNLYNFYYSEDVKDDPAAMGRIPSYELTDGAKAAEWLTGELLTAYWYFVAV